MIIHYIVWNQGNQNQDSDEGKHIMDSEGIDKSLGNSHIAYDFWNIHINNIFPSQT